jgi:hypothetical protein
VTVTRLQSIAPSCGSLTVTVYGMPSPHSKKSPSVGTLTVTVGAVLPTVICMVTGKGSSRALVIAVTNRGNTVDPVDVSGSGGGRSGAISPMRILPGKTINLRLLSSAACRRGRTGQR